MHHLIKTVSGTCNLSAQQDKFPSLILEDSRPNTAIRSPLHQGTTPDGGLERGREGGRLGEGDWRRKRSDGPYWRSWRWRTYSVGSKRGLGEGADCVLAPEPAEPATIGVL